MPIYKYVTEERIDILQNAHIRFTQPSEFNDPFELNPYLKSLSDSKFIDEIIDDWRWDEDHIDKISEENSKKTLKEALDEIKNQYNVTISEEQIEKVMGIKPQAFIKKHLKETMYQYKPIITSMAGSMLKLETPGCRQIMLPILKNAMNREIGVLSLTEKPCNLLMWAHYADGYKGFVIKFDDKHKFFDQRTKPGELRGHLIKVRYSKQRPHFILFDPNLNDSENLDNWMSNFLCVKSEHWEYEQEWRMFYTLRECKKRITEGNHEICLVPIPIECVKGITLGCNILEESKQNIIALLKSNDNYSHIKLSHIELDEKEFRLNIIEDRI